MFDPEKVTYTLTVQQDDTPVHGNASAIDDDTDREIENEIHRRLDSGDVWAWCVVKVTAQYPGIPLKGVDYLGGCNYRDEKEFVQPGGYYEDMKAAALEDLQRQVEEIRQVVCA